MSFIYDVVGAKSANIPDEDIVKELDSINLELGGKYKVNEAFSAGVPLEDISKELFNIKQEVNNSNPIDSTIQNNTNNIENNLEEKPEKINTDSISVKEKELPEFKIPEVKNKDLILETSKITGVEPKLIYAMENIESNNGKSLLSPTGVRGSMQVTKKTGETYIEDFNPDDPKENLLAGALHIRTLMDKFSNDPLKMAVAYNFGEQIIDEAVALSNKKGTEWITELENTDTGKKQNKEFAKKYPETYDNDLNLRTNEAGNHGEKFLKVLGYEPKSDKPIDLSLREKALANTGNIEPEPEKFTPAPAPSTDPTLLTPFKAVGVGIVDKIRDDFFAIDKGKRELRERGIDKSKLSEEETAKLLEPTVFKRLANKLDKWVDPETREEISKAQKLSGDPLSWASAGVTGAGSNIGDFATQWGLTSVGLAPVAIAEQITRQTGSFLYEVDQIAKSSKLTAKEQLQWEDLTDKISLAYGIGSGLLEFTGNAFGPLAGQATKAVRNKLAGKIIQKYGKDAAEKTFLKSAMGEILGWTGEGVTEGGQSALKNFLLSSAIVEMRKSKPDFMQEWKPESITESMVQGFLTSAFMTGGKNAVQKYSGSQQINEDKIDEIAQEEIKAQSEKESKLVEKMNNETLGKPYNIRVAPERKTKEELQPVFLKKGQHLPSNYEFTGNQKTENGVTQYEAKPEISHLEKHNPEMALEIYQEELNKIQKDIDENDLNNKPVKELSLKERENVARAEELQDKIKSLQPELIPLDSKEDVNQESQNSEVIQNESKESEIVETESKNIPEKIKDKIKGIQLETSNFDKSIDGKRTYKKKLKVGDEKRAENRRTIEDISQEFKNEFPELSDSRAMEYANIAARHPVSGLPSQPLMNSKINEIRKKSKSDVAVISLDINHFKSINDTHGHVFGDEVMVNVQTALNQIAQEFDIEHYHKGGDEAIILVDNLTPEKTENLKKALSEIKNEIAGFDIEHNGISVPIGISAGISIGESKNIESILNEAELILNKKVKNSFIFSDEAKKKHSFTDILGEDVRSFYDKAGMAKGREKDADNKIQRTADKTKEPSPKPLQESKRDSNRPKFSGESTKQSRTELKKSKIQEQNKKVIQVKDIGKKKETIVPVKKEKKEKRKTEDLNKREEKFLKDFAGVFESNPDKKGIHKLKIEKPKLKSAQDKTGIDLEITTNRNRIKILEKAIKEKNLPIDKEQVSLAIKALSKKNDLLLLKKKAPKYQPEKVIVKVNLKEKKSSPGEYSAEVKEGNVIKEEISPEEIKVRRELDNLVDKKNNLSKEERRNPELIEKLDDEIYQKQKEIINHVSIDQDENKGTNQALENEISKEIEELNVESRYDTNIESRKERIKLIDEKKIQRKKVSLGLNPDTRISVKELQSLQRIKSEIDNLEKQKESATKTKKALIDAKITVRKANLKKRTNFYKRMDSQRGSINIGAFTEVFSNPIKSVSEAFKTNRKYIRKLVGTDFQKIIGRFDVMRMNSELFIKDIEKNTTPEERAILVFIMEGEKRVPTGKRFKIRAMELQEQWNNIKKDKKRYKELLGIGVKIRNHNRNLFKIISENIDGMEEREVRKYIPHIWGTKGGPITENDVVEFKKFMTENKSLNKRVFGTYREGIRHGFRPKYLDVAQLININTQAGLQVAANRAMIDMMKGNNEAGVTLLSKTNDATDGMGWKRLNEVGVKVKDLEGYSVDPNAMPIVNAMFKDKYRAGWITALETFSGFLKKAQLSYSFFHHNTLGETGIATQGYRKTFKSMANITAMYKAAKNGSYDVVLKNIETASDFVEHGGQLGAISDLHLDHLDSFLFKVQSQFEKVHSKAGAPIQALRDVNKVWDRLLWDYFHNTLKIDGYSSLIEHNLAKLNPQSEKEIKIVKMETAQLVNDTFGGQNWTALMTNPKIMQISQGLLLSPDWTLSTARQFLSPLGVLSITKTDLGKKTRSSMGKRFWSKAFLKYYLGLSLINMAFRIGDEEDEWLKKLKKKQEKIDKSEAELNSKNYVQIFGSKKMANEYITKEKSEINKLKSELKEIEKNKPSRFPSTDIMKYTMFGNSIGHKTELFVGRNEDGTERYRGTGKQFTDVFEYMFLLNEPTGIEFNPLEALPHKLLGKANPSLQLVSLWTRNQTLNGYIDRDLEKARSKGGEAYYKQLLKSTAKSFLPFSAQAIKSGNKEFTFVDLATSQRKGASKYFISEGVREVLRDVREGRSSGVEKTLSELKKSGERNGIDYRVILYRSFYSMMNHAKNDMKTKKYEYNKLLKKVDRTRRDEREMEKFQKEYDEAEFYIKSLKNGVDLIRNQLSNKDLDK